ncbi:HAD family hydrolase [Fluviicola taffensis]|uniref:HAD-superfamily hydrolase, subfamily IA, variant 3 n=1 Tax=Fluviicola taffensis (strain DSM 16823 / NCIMB 13979 / RW262) TaxID=755732 RepID=F2IDI7_FLUTR|nr:HAD family phosphatase [Fluviicola taffensis]AEA42363.1 HAD-superfamily hydrolase, subfamily IA, variant 3 [Fluviicola taffensis DSM 16823]
MISKPKAFLFDLNGTMINDMGFHLEVWNKILNEDLNAGLVIDQVKQQMYGKNHELLDRVFGKGVLSEEDIEFYSQRKEELYQELYAPHLALIPGLGTFFETASKSNISMTIGSAANRFNINFVVDNLNIRSFFQAIVSAEDVLESKPNPEVFLKAANLLGFDPELCIVFEDVPKGAEAALNAGMKVVIVTTTHSPEEFAQYSNVLFFIKDYNDPRLTKLFS